MTQKDKKGLPSPGMMPPTKFGGKIPEGIHEAPQMTLPGQQDDDPFSMSQGASDVKGSQANGG